MPVLVAYRLLADAACRQGALDPEHLERDRAGAAIARDLRLTDSHLAMATHRDLDAWAATYATRAGWPRWTRA